MSIPVWGGVRFSATGRKLKQIIDLYPGDKRGLYVTSSLRNEPGSYHGGTWYGGSPGAAVDIGFGYGSSGYQARARAFAQWLYQFSGDTVELIVSRVGSSNSNGGFYVKNQGRTGAYAHTGGNTSVRHEDHVHFATTSALADRILSRIRSSGGGSAPSTTQPSQPSGTAQNVIAVTPWYSRPTLRQGSRGGAVGHLQFLLRDRLGYKIDRVNGSPFGPQTHAAVVDFQRKYRHLQNNGVVAGNTWAQLEVVAAKAISPQNRPVIRQGSRGMWVLYAQHCLRKNGARIDNVQGGPFGPQTQSAMVAFQRRYSWLDNTGAVGPNTWRALDAVEAGKTPKDPSAPAPTQPSAPSGTTQGDVAVTPYGSRPHLRQGDRGPAVGHLQFLLRDRLGYRIDRVDGSPFGPQTHSAVVDFQRKHSALQNNGVVGTNTWTLLEVAAAQAISLAGRPTLRRDGKGMWVGYAQHCLRATGHRIDEVQGFPYGPQTEAAMKDEQKKHGIQSTGRVLSNTWKMLDDLLSPRPSNPPSTVPPRDTDPAQPEFVTRAEWGAAEPTYSFPEKTDWEGVTVHHTAGPKGQDVRQVQQAGFNAGVQDIHYHFVIKDGKVYEGGGWNELRWHDSVNRNLGVCVVGTYTNSLPDDADMRALDWVIAEFRRRFKKQKVVGHRDVSATSCPGNALYDEITRRYAT